MSICIRCKKYKSSREFGYCHICASEINKITESKSYSKNGIAVALKVFDIEQKLRMS